MSGSLAAKNGSTSLGRGTGRSSALGEMNRVMSGFLAAKNGSASLGRGTGRSPGLN